MIFWGQSMQKKQRFFYYEQNTVYDHIRNRANNLNRNKIIHDKKLYVFFLKDEEFYRKVAYSNPSFDVYFFIHQKFFNTF